MKKQCLMILMLVFCLILCGCQCRHEWADAECLRPQICGKCQQTQGEALGHDWQAPGCETAAACTRCGITEGSALGHDWKPAACEMPKTCGLCGQTEGEALPHAYTRWEIREENMERACSLCGDQEVTQIDWETYIRSGLLGAWTVETCYNDVGDLCDGGDMNSYWEYDTIYVNFLDQENVQLCGFGSGTDLVNAAYTLEAVKDENEQLLTYIIWIRAEGMEMPLYVAGYHQEPSFAWNKGFRISASDPDYVRLQLEPAGDRLAFRNGSFIFMFARENAILEIDRAWRLLEGTWVLDPSLGGEDIIGESITFSLENGRCQFSHDSELGISGIWVFNSAIYWPESDRYELQYTTNNSSNMYGCSIAIEYSSDSEPFLRLYLSPRDESVNRRIMYYTKEGAKLENVITTGNFYHQTHLAGTWIVEPDLSLVPPDQEALEFVLNFQEDGTFRLDLDKEVTGTWKEGTLSIYENRYFDSYDLSLQEGSGYNSISVSVQDYYRDMRDVLVLYCKTSEDDHPVINEYRFVKK